MLLNELHGYMLGGNGHVAVRGDQWMASDDVPVCIFHNLDGAKSELEKTQQTTREWTTVYKVHAADIDVFQISGTQILTRQPSKIFVDGVVCYSAADGIKKQQLLASVRHKIQKSMNMQSIAGKEK